MKLVWKLISKYKALSLPVKASAWFVVCSVLQRGVSFITTPIFTRTLSQEEYGSVSLYNTWETILIIIATLELSTGVFNKAMLKFADDRDGFTSSMLSFSGISTMVVFTLYWCFRNRINMFTGLSTQLTLLLFMQILFSMGSSLLISRRKFEYEYKPVVAVILTTCLLSTIVSLILVLSNDTNRDYYRILGNLLVLIPLNSIIIIYIFVKGKKPFEIKYITYALLYNLPLIPHYLSQQILNQSDRVMISQMCGKDKVAIYTVAYQVAAICLLFINAIHSSFTPWCYKALEEKKYDIIKKRTFELTVFIGFICLLFPLFAPEVIYVLGGKQYLEAIFIVPPVSMSVLYVTVYTFFANIQFYFEKTKFVMVASSLAAGLNIVLNYIFIRKYGFIAAGFTTLFCYMIYSFAHFVFMKKVCKQYGITVPFASKRIWFVCLILTFISVSISLLYKYTFLRYGIIAVLMVGIFCYWCKNKNTILGK